MSGKDYLNPEQFAERRVERDAAIQAAKDRHPAGKGRDDAGEKLKAEYVKVRDSGMMKPVADRIKAEMTPEERRAQIRRKNRPKP